MLVHVLSSAHAPNPAWSVGATTRRIGSTTAVSRPPRYLLATVHRYEDVVDPVAAMNVKVGGFWYGEPIEEVSLVALDQFGHVTVKLSTIRFQTVADFVRWQEARRGDGWLPTEEAARLAYEGTVLSCLC